MRLTTKVYLATTLVATIGTGAVGSTSVLLAYQNEITRVSQTLLDDAALLVGRMKNDRAAATFRALGFTGGFSLGLAGCGDLPAQSCLHRGRQLAKARDRDKAAFQCRDRGHVAALAEENPAGLGVHVEGAARCVGGDRVSQRLSLQQSGSRQSAAPRTRAARR